MYGSFLSFFFSSLYCSGLLFFACVFLLFRFCSQDKVALRFVQMAWVSIVPFFVISCFHLSVFVFKEAEQKQKQKKVATNTASIKNRHLKTSNQIFNCFIFRSNNLHCKKIDVSEVV